MVTPHHDLTPLTLQKVNFRSPLPAQGRLFMPLSVKRLGARVLSMTLPRPTGISSGALKLLQPPNAPKFNKTRTVKKWARSRAEKRSLSRRNFLTLMGGACQHRLGEGLSSPRAKHLEGVPCSFSVERLASSVWEGLEGPTLSFPTTS